MDSLYNVALLRRAISCDPAAMLMVVQNYNVQGKIDDDDYIKMLGQINREIAGAEELLEEYESQQKSNEEFKKHIEVIRHRLLEAQRDAALGVVSKDFVDQYIDKIFVTPEPDGAIRLDIRIYTGDTTARYLDKLTTRIGQMEANTAEGEGSEVITSVCAVDIRAGQMSKKIYRPSAGMNEARTEKISVRALIIIQM